MKIIILILLFCNTSFGQKCLLWNKLQDSNCRSIIGNNGTLSGSEAFETCKFNNGAIETATQKIINFGNIGVQNKGCIEQWITPKSNSGTATGFEWIFCFLEDTDNRIYFGFSYDNSKFYHNIRVGGVSTQVEYATSWAANDLIHLGFVWDKNAGFDSTKTSAMYINGTQVVSSTSEFNFASTFDNLYLLGVLPTDNDNCMNTVVDNVKVWNYAKTDFSDRHKEAFRQTGHYH